MFYEIRVVLQLPAMIFEDNSAVVTVTTEENAYVLYICTYFTTNNKIHTMLSSVEGMLADTRI
jgi:hypothetical protein